MCNYLQLPYETPQREETPADQYKHKTKFARKGQIMASSPFGVGRNVRPLASPDSAAHLMGFLGSAEGGRFFVPA
jgi:hypothetical protein